MTTEDLTALEDDALDALDQKLAKERTALREQQVAVQNEKAFRAALVNMSPDQQAAFAVRVGGSVGTGSSTSTTKTERAS